MHLIGAALTGTVVNVSGTAVQVALEIDKESGNPAAFWFLFYNICFAEWKRLVLYAGTG